MYTLTHEHCDCFIRVTALLEYLDFSAFLKGRGGKGSTFPVCSSLCPPLKLVYGCTIKQLDY